MHRTVETMNFHGAILGRVAMFVRGDQSFSFPSTELDELSQIISILRAGLDDEPVTIVEEDLQSILVDGGESEAGGVVEDSGEQRDANNKVTRHAPKPTVPQSETGGKLSVTTVVSVVVLDCNEPPLMIGSTLTLPEDSSSFESQFDLKSVTSDPDVGDNTGCWWMQVVPNADYNDSGYLEGYNGSGQYHQWQVLWLR